MHISVRHDIFYDFYKAFRPRLLTPFDLRLNIDDKWKASESYVTQVGFLKAAVLVLIFRNLQPLA